MQCPACKQNMSAHEFEQLTLDVCDQGCHGIWFDWMELKKINKKGSNGGEKLSSLLEYNLSLHARPGNIKCPKCFIDMHKRKYNAAIDLDVDECYACGGFFLDAGELSVIRQADLSQEDKNKALENLLLQCKAYSINTFDPDNKSK